MKYSLKKNTDCPGCGVVLPSIDGPIHPYMHSSAACWHAFGTVLSREYSEPKLLQVRRLSVDAYAVQHPGDHSRRAIQSVGVHLVRLCLFLERGLSAQNANNAMLRAARNKNAYTYLEPPEILSGSLTVADVLKTSTTEEHITVVHDWAASAWHSWAAHHEQVRIWANFQPHHID